MNKAAFNFYISRVQIESRIVERTNTGDTVEEVRKTVENINCGKVLAIRRATETEKEIILNGGLVTFIRQVGMNL